MVPKNTMFMRNTPRAHTDDISGRIAKHLISERFRSKATVRSDMIESFKRHGLTRDELVSETVLQIIAGSDTTATAIRSTILFLMANPAAYHALQIEIDAAVETGRVSRPVIKDSEAQQLPYLQAVIKEGLRIFPPAAPPVPKVVLREGDQILQTDGKTVRLPGGTNIGCSVWGVQHSKDVFGPDADSFRPERWLEASGERLARMQKTAGLVFGYGKYQCLGRNVATMELNKVFFEARLHVIEPLQRRCELTAPATPQL